MCCRLSIAHRGRLHLGISEGCFHPACVGFLRGSSDKALSCTLVGPRHNTGSLFGGPTALKCRAFISYSHTDASGAKWLHRALETFRIDKELVGRETVSSVPLSLTIMAGLPRASMRVSSSRATRIPDSEVSATNARHSRVKSSTMAKIRKRLLQASASVGRQFNRSWCDSSRRDCRQNGWQPQ